MDRKNISMVDIARMSGVSIATVSRVLNKNGRYSAETEKKVMAVVEKYNYAINPNAQGLRTNRTKTIGLIIPDITNEYFSQIVRSVESSVIPLGYNVFVCDSNENIDYELHHISSLQSKGVEGIIYISARKSVDEITKEFTVPVVYIDRRPGVEFNYVSSDNENGGFLATEELIKKGCRRIILIHDVNTYSTVNKRIQGYLRAHKQYGVEIDRERMVPCRVSYFDARETVKKLIDDGTDFDGIFCTTDSMALGALKALKDSEKKVPEEVKLVGFDGITHTMISDPPITTVVQDTDQLGKRSAEVLMDLINNKTDKIHEYTIPVRLSVRGSTDGTR